MISVIGEYQTSPILVFLEMCNGIKKNDCLAVIETFRFPNSLTPHPLTSHHAFLIPLVK